MIEGMTASTVATVAEAGAGAEERAVIGATEGAEIDGLLTEAGNSAFETPIGGTTESFADTLKLDPHAVGEAIRGRAEVSGALEALPGRPGFDAERWIDYRPPQGELTAPQAIAERFRPLRDPGNLESYAKELQQRDPSFGQEVDRRCEQFRAAGTPAERDAALQQLRQSTAGKLGESIAIDGLSPFFEKVELQRRVETPAGTTIVDARFTEARNPVVFGRGNALTEGGNLSVEVKTGQPMYLQREVPHISERQVPGHLASGDNSLVLVSRDVYRMSGERAARDTVAEAGSHVMALLPEKGVMDEVLTRLVRDRLEGTRP